MNDISIECKDCNKIFILTIAEQEFLAERGIHQPRICRECIRHKKYEMQSDKLKEFVEEIKYINRNPLDNSVLSFLKDIDTNPQVVIKPNDFLYRARIITNCNDINKEKNFLGYSKEGSFVPPIKMTKDMRANYKYIPYLYCTDNLDIAISEVRPRIGADVSIAKIMVNENLRIFDFTISQKPADISTSKIKLCEDLSEIFSSPIVNDEDTINYVPTQYISEFIKNLGYDGIKYKSVNKSCEINGANFVIFNYPKCEPIKSNVITIKNVQLFYKKNDDDTVDIFN
ncbi:RES domain-containing protein [Anaerocolumna sp. AGMB13020]|uniref:RES domain-containing protein n=1 Tax=Anaerocolumna sp. AGMB13020 TaxID=3081750 RepID=UPI0029537BE3|nr:RES domain-containing protein [Anaerocolumna sp. AGMB13020]WOO35035.1 RES domain-containing protein [Anaerocolumna sp. AGMB13020]